MSDQLNLTATACDIAIRGAGEYIRRHNIEPDYAVLSEALKREVRAALPGAMEDAREAFACHMDQVAMLTFSASLTAAGIAAAKSCGFAVRAGAPKAVSAGVAA